MTKSFPYQKRHYEKILTKGDITKRVVTNNQQFGNFKKKKAASININFNEKFIYLTGSSLME